MDIDIISQIKLKKFWWMDIIFYFVVSALIATVLCYGIFLLKNSMLKDQINNEEKKLQEIGTNSQKDQEKEVLSYKEKINDFSYLLKNHQFASNVFAFMQTQTMPNVWFKNFSFDQKNSGIQLSGQSDDMDGLSRQVNTFEKNKYVKSIGALNSSLGESARVDFNINLTLDKSVFSYLSDMYSVINAASPSQGSALELSSGSAEGSEKLITSFRLKLNPEVVGIIDQSKNTIILNVPYGTDITNLTPSIIVSTLATVLPDSEIPQNFTAPVTYVVTAGDGTTQSYQVAVAVSAPSSGKGSFSIGKIVAVIFVIISLISIAAVIIFIRKTRNKK